MSQARTLRAPLHADVAATERIRRQTQENIAYFAEHPHLIRYRLQELDREPDVEWVLETLSSAASVMGFLLALRRRRRFWLAMPLLAQALCLQHAVLGRNWSSSFLRRLGLRNRAEIADERSALRALHGDLRPVGRNAEVGESGW